MTQAKTFSALRFEALAEIRFRVRNGEFTERQLARVARLSQTHVHNVLGCKREASIEALDKLRAAAERVRRF